MPLRSPRSSAFFATRNAPVLELKGLTKHFGGVRAVDNVDLAVAQGEILGLIGPNGSGKSTIVNLICGLFPPTSGQVMLRGMDISALPPHARVALGIARTFQNIRLFGQLTVWQNLWVAQNSGEQPGQESTLRRWLGGSRHARAEIARAASSISPTSAMNWPPISRSANSGGWNSPVHLLRSLHWCCWTSRPRA